MENHNAEQNESFVSSREGFSIASAIEKLMQSIDDKSKLVLQEYDIDMSLETQKKHLMQKFNVANLEHCAGNLQIKTKNDEGKKLFRKEALVMKIIAKIESLFPQYCGECSTEYVYELKDVPTHTCLQCGVPAHNCLAYQEIKKLPAGFIWLCGTCLDQTKKTGLIAYDAEPTNVEPNSEAKEQVEQQTEAKQKKTVDAANSPTVTSICNRYRRGQCPHGKNGKKLVEGNKCNYVHPRKCRQYCNAGLDKQHGCRFGKKCKFLHPILCPSSRKRDGVCMGESCKLVHLKVIRYDNAGPELRGQQGNVDAASIVGTKMKVDNVARCRGGSTNHEPVTATPSATKNEQLERIEQTLLSMQTKHDSEIRMMRQELVQIRGGLPMPWMGPQCPWMSPPNPAASHSHQAPLSYSPNLQHSSS